MRLEEFAEKVLKEVMEKAGDSLRVQIVPGNKNNGVTLIGITASRPGSSGAPVSIWMVIMRIIAITALHLMGWQRMFTVNSWNTAMTLTEWI